MVSIFQNQKYILYLCTPKHIPYICTKPFIYHYVGLRLIYLCTRSTLYIERQKRRGNLNRHTHTHNTQNRVCAMYRQFSHNMNAFIFTLGMNVWHLCIFWCRQTLKERECVTVHPAPIRIPPFLKCCVFTFSIKFSCVCLDFFGVNI